jgi:uncharacterized protein (DUF433 family)
MASDAVSRAEKILHPPGIEFHDETADRTAYIASTQVAVWELINEYRTCGNDRTQFYAAFDVLTPEQFNAAFDFYQAFPEEVDKRIALEGGAGHRYVKRAPEGHGRIAPA